MDKQNEKTSQREFDKVVELLTPRHPRPNSFVYNRPATNIRKRLWMLGGIAAMIAVVVTLAAKSVIPASATEIAEVALTSLTEAESVKIDFEILGSKTSGEEVYTPDLRGETVSGTLYIQKRDGRVRNRVDWHDIDRNSIIYDGGSYVHLKNGIMADKRESAFDDELMNLLSLNTLRQSYVDLIRDAESSESGNIITMKHVKNEITFTGEFRKDNRQLIRALVTATSPDGQELTVLATKAIELNPTLPDSLFTPASAK